MHPKGTTETSDRCAAEIEGEGTNLEVFSLALQNWSLKEEDLLGRQTPVTKERKDQHFCNGYLLC